MFMGESGVVKTNARAAERRPAMAASTMRAEGTTPIDVLVIDVSSTGIRIATAIELAIGQEISIGLAGAGATRAFVAWKHDGHYGCQFERPLEPDGDARAFSRAPVVHLGRGEVAQPEHDLRELYSRHRPWKLPLDAILVIIGEIGLVAVALWWLFGR
jgi:hypothetical protein